MTTINPTDYAELGVVTHADTDEATVWRVLLYDGKTAPAELLFAEEPEHRAIETLMIDTDATAVRVVPPMTPDPTTADDAADRLLAVARGLKSSSSLDQDALADLVTAAIAYQSLYRSETI